MCENRKSYSLILLHTNNENRVLQTWLNFCLMFDIFHFNFLLIPTVQFHSMFWFIYLFIFLVYMEVVRWDTIWQCGSLIWHSTVLTKARSYEYVTLEVIALSAACFVYHIPDTCLLDNSISSECLNDATKIS